MIFAHENETQRLHNDASARVFLLLNVLLIGAWLWLYWPIFDYLAVIFTRDDFRTNQVLLIAIIGLIALQLKRQQWRMPLHERPQWTWLPLLFAIGGSMGYLLAERFLDVNTLSASLFVLASYGLLGLWLDAAPWRAGMPAALLLVGVLPFGEHMQTFVGYPMRIATAAVVRDGLSALGVASVGIDTILVFENGVSHVDLPCSGVKSLWTGTLFLIAATWIERKPIRWPWLLTAGLFAGLLFAVNTMRVAVLILVGEVQGWRLWAEMLHVPLGVIGFVAACGAAVWLLSLQSSRTTLLLNDTAERPMQQPAWLLPALLVAVVVMALLYTPRPQQGLAQAPMPLAFPAELATQPLPLKPDELAWLQRDGAESATRLRFTWRDQSGTMILITSRTWRAHHRPERCFEVYGLSINDSRTHLVSSAFPVRIVALGEGGTNLASATYWFQSAERTTDEYATRIWADLAPQRDRWVLVSIVFDGTVDPNDADVRDFYTTLHDTVAQNLRAGG